MLANDLTRKAREHLNSILPREFYMKYTPIVAKKLLGKMLVRILPSGNVLAGMIVETEAYRGKDDPASHAYKGKTHRNTIMFGPPGHAYIYLIYGMYYCLNVVTEPEGCPAAVLIRAIQPLLGISEMIKLRKVNKLRLLTNGPGRLTQAMMIDKALNGVDMTQLGPLYITDLMTIPDDNIGISPRIGIKDGKDKLWRFFIKNNPFVSYSAQRK